MDFISTLLTNTLPSALSIYSNYRLNSQQIAANQAAQAAQYPTTYSGQTSNLLPLMLLGGGVILAVVLLKGKK